jgi:hypothetical protein
MLSGVGSFVNFSGSFPVLFFVVFLTFSYFFILRLKLNVFWSCNYYERRLRAACVTSQVSLFETAALAPSARDCSA